MPVEDDPRDELIFMQDGAKYHIEKNVIDYLRKNVDTFNWPAQSPDLNIIENVWVALKNELWAKREQSKNANDVWRETREIFNSFTLVYIHSLWIFA